MRLVCFTRVNDFRHMTRHCGWLYGIYKHMHDIWGYYFPTLGFEQLYYYTFQFGTWDWGIMLFIILCYVNLICCLSSSTIFHYSWFQLSTCSIHVYCSFYISCFMYSWPPALDFSWADLYRRQLITPSDRHWPGIIWAGRLFVAFWYFLSFM